MATAGVLSVPSAPVRRESRPRPPAPRPARVAIVHDYLTQRGGAERVVLALLRAFPDARLVTGLYDPERTFPEFRDYHVETSRLSRYGVLRADPRRALPLLPATFSGLKIRDVDLVISSTSGWAHGVDAGDAPMLAYCHNPPRWLHQPEQYLAGQPAHARMALAMLRRPLLRWDRRAAESPTTYVANSTAVAGRISAAYGRQAQVVPPPYGLDPAGPRAAVPGLEPGFLLTVSRGRAYKNVAAACEAVEARPDLRLVVVGPLPHRRDGWSPRITSVTDVTDAQLRWLYRNSRGLLALSHEDFGLTPLEANAFGRPALCLRAGGYLDTLRPNVSGVFTDSLESPAVADAVDRLLTQPWNADRIRDHAAQFAPQQFAARIHALAGDLVGAHLSLGGAGLRGPLAQRRAA